MIEATFQIGVEHLLALLADVGEDRLDGVMAASSRSEPIAVGFESGFPLRFERELDEGLMGSVEQHGNAERSLLGLARL